MNTTEIINYSKDIDFEYNMKFIVLALLSIYALFGLWYIKSREPQYLYQFYVYKIINVFSICYITILPLWVFFLSRNVPIDVILRPMVVFYSVIVIIAAFSLFVFGGEKIKEFFTGEGFYRNRK